MATFISTVKFTAQGVRGLKETTKRAAALKGLAKRAGAKIKDIYWTLGDADGVLIFEAADDESATAFLAQVAVMGNVQTSTMRAFTAAEMDQILGKVAL